MIATGVGPGVRALHDQFGILLRDSRAPRVRTMREFAEQEITIPSGQYAGMRFSCRRQPLSALWFDAIDERTSPWPERVITGPSQSGKTLLGFVIPILYHLFELRETVIAACPDFDMIRDKWEQDIEPVLSRTRYRQWLPAVGGGSKGGVRTSIRFGHGPILRWMSANARDKSRAAFTSRVVCMTETDGFDVRTSTSDEADKIKQIEARTRSYPVSQRRIYKECTLTTDQGHTWMRYHEGTASRIVLPCPHCDAWVSPERADLHGWRDAANEIDAMDRSCFHCSECGEAWTEDQRRDANHRALLVHRGQQIEGGQVEGEATPTTTLGFRWSAVNNLLVPASDVGLDEWRASRAVDEDNAERELCQFVWAVPYRPIHDQSVILEVPMLQDRQNGLGRGQLPEGCTCVTVGVDVGSKALHWTAIAWVDETGYVIDYSVHGVKHANVVFREGIMHAMDSLRGKLGSGWSTNRVDMVVVDTRWESGSVIKAVKALNDRKWRCFMGLGEGHWARARAIPEKRKRDTIWLGDQTFERIIERAGESTITMFADANYWKTWLHNRLVVEIEPGQELTNSVTLYSNTDSNPHYAFARQLTAEREVQRFEPGRGYLKVWESLRADNHWLDSTYMACVAAHRIGFGKRLPTKKQAAGVNRLAPMQEQPTWSVPVFER